MDIQLEAFISQTLKQIINAVIETQKYAKTVNAKVYPEMYSPGTSGAPPHFLDLDRKAGHFIEFDVAVTASKSKSEKEGIGVSVIQVGLSKIWNKALSDSSTSRIKFTIPVVLPFQK